MKKQPSLMALLIAVLVLAFVSCDKKAPAQAEPKAQTAATAEPQATAPEAQCDVYLAGSVRDKNGDLVPTVWKNGEVLWNPAKWAFGAGIESLVVSGPDVYAGGYENAKSREMVGEDVMPSFATIWKNGKLLWRLTDGKLPAKATRLAVAGSDVYAAGYEVAGDEENLTSAVLVWKNGKLLRRLTDGYADANAMAVAGQDVYVGGCEFVGEAGDGERLALATIWKNAAVRWRPTDGTDASIDRRVLHLAISGNDVYAAGTGTSPILWKNGSALWSLNDSATVEALCVSGANVYEGGHESMGEGETQKATATVWKNGKALWRMPDDNRVKVLYLLGSDVYAAGYEYNAMDSVVVWKNGKFLTRLSVGPSAILNAFVLAQRPQ